jgi:hypothetical protein
MLSVLVQIFSAILASCLLLFTNGSVKAESAESDVSLTIKPVVKLSIANCDGSKAGTVAINIDPARAGVFKSACQNVSVDANTPGYSLSVKSSSTDLVYQNPTTVSPKPKVPSTAATIKNPAKLTNNQWGFAIEKQTGMDGSIGFETSYTVDNADNKYALLPTTSQTIYQTDKGLWEDPAPLSTFKVFYGSKLTLDTVAGKYKTTITYTAIGTDVPEGPTACGGDSHECILFTGTTDDGTFDIPTRGYVTGSATHTYDWDIEVDGDPITDCDGGSNCVGTASESSTEIALSGLSNGEHQIKITPHDSPEPGWGNAFGCRRYSAHNSCYDIISLDAPLTTKAFAPKTTESTTNASYMFADVLFMSGVSGAVSFKDTYKLPSAITDLSHFLDGFLSQSYKSRSTIDLSGIANWLEADTNITNLSYFMANHFMACYRCGSNNLVEPVDLAPLSNWFSDNGTITNLSHFLDGAYSGGSVMMDVARPINLTPLAGWFNGNDSITDLSFFLSRTHEGNRGDTSMKDPIDLSPLSGWFKANNSIANLSGFLESLHSGGSDNETCGTTVAKPTNLSPVAGWFSQNTSVTNLSDFLAWTHNCNTALVDPIDMTPLAGWFSANRTFVSLERFLAITYHMDYALSLSGQVIFPNWMKTAKEGTAPIYDATGSFHFTFTYSKGTAEPKFQDGTALSSVGTPATNKETYRWANITPVNSNWK